MTSLAEWNTAPTRADPPASVWQRIVVVLDAVREADGPVTVTELAVHTGLPKSTVSRLVTELTEHRYLQRTDGGVSLGLRLFEFGARARLPRRLAVAAGPVIAELARLTGERVGFWVHQGSDMIAVATAPGRLPMLPTRAGTRSPALTTASGKAFLAFCRDRRVVDRVSAGLHDDAAADEFRVELTHVRHAQIATDSGGAYPGVDAVAGPLFTADQTVIGSISVAGPQGAIRSEEIAPLVRAAGVTLARRLLAA